MRTNKAAEKAARAAGYVMAGLLTGICIVGLAWLFKIMLNGFLNA